MSNGSQTTPKSPPLGHEAWLGAVIVRWVDFVGRRPGVVLLCGLALVLLAGVHAATSLSVVGETSALFSDELRYKQAERQYAETFPGQANDMWVVLDAATPEQAGLAASALAAELLEYPAAIQSVYRPGAGEFFERNAFLYLDVPELNALADELVEAQASLAELARDGSLRGLASLLSKGVRAIRDGEIAEARLLPMLDQMRSAIEAFLHGEDYQVSWSEVISSRAFDLDPRRQVLLVSPVLNASDLQPGRLAIEAIRAASRAAGLADAPLVQLRVTGDTALAYEDIEVVKSQAAVAGVVSFVLVGLILWLGLRSLRLVMATLVTLLIGLVLTAGFTSVVIGHLNMISAAFAVLFIGLGVDFAVHFCTRYREAGLDLVASGSPEQGSGARDATVAAHAAALRMTARDIGGSLVLCALTTSIGFLAFVPTPFVGVAELGIISSGGMAIGLLCALTLLPALLSFPRPSPFRGKSAALRWEGWGVDFPARHPHRVRMLAAGLALFALIFLPQARFDNNPLNVRDPGSESVQALAELLSDPARSPWTLNAVARDASAADALAAQLRALPEVDRVVTLSDFVPAAQTEKLAIIDDVALLLGPFDGPRDPQVVPAFDAQRDALKALEVELARLDEIEVSAAFRTVAGDVHALLLRLFSHFEAFPKQRARDLATLEASLMATLPEQLRLLRQALRAERVETDSLPVPLLERMRTSQGVVRVEIFPRADPTDPTELASFVDSVRRIAPNVSGNAAKIVGTSEAVVTSLRQALITGLFAVTCVVFLLWRRVGDTALVLVPLALAMALTIASAVALGIPFNFADIIVLPLLLGIGIDSGIHLVHRARAADGEGRGLLGTSTARAVAFSALTTIASFGAMGLASHRGLATLGQLLTLGVAFTLLCNLVVLPALIVRTHRRC